jgi:hypothetical protein
MASYRATPCFHGRTAEYRDLVTALAAEHAPQGATEKSLASIG